MKNVGDLVLFLMVLPVFLESLERKSDDREDGRVESKQFQVP